MKNIFKHDILLPFVNFIFDQNYTSDAVIKRLRNEHVKINNDDTKSESLAKAYADIVERLNEAHKNALLSALSYSVIIRLTRRVINKLLYKQETVRKKVGEIMGGKVLDLPEIRAYHQGIERGIEQGRIASLMQMLSRGGTEEQLRIFLNATDEEIALAKEQSELMQG